MNRRTFLSNGIATGVLFANGNLFGAQAPSNRVRLIMMGCQAKGRGFQLMKAAAALPNVEIATVCDVDSRALLEASATILKRTGKTPRQEKDFRKALEDPTIDGVICAAPDHWHATAGVWSMQAGKAIYLEKPMAHNIHEGEILLETAQKHHGIFQLGTQRRSSKVFQEVIQAIRSGIIGEPHAARCWYVNPRKPIGRAAPTPVPEWLDWDLWQGPAPRQPFQANAVHYSWRWFKAWGTGEAGNNGPHFFDVARLALNVTLPERITSGGGRYYYDQDDWEWPDTQFATFEYPGKKIVQWESFSSIHGVPFNNEYAGCLVYGLGGTVFFSPQSICTLYAPDGKKVKSWEPKGKLSSSTISITNPTDNLDCVYLQKFIDCIRAKNPETAATATEGFATTFPAWTANIAQQTGETVRVNPVTGQLLAPAEAKTFWTRTYEKGWELKA